MPGLATKPLDAGEERRLFAADVGAGADAHLDLHVGGDSCRVQHLGGAAKPRPRLGKLGPDVHPGVGCPGDCGCDQEALEDGKRIAFHQHPILERARLRFVAVGDDVLGFSGCPSRTAPLGGHREGGTAPAPEIGPPEFIEYPVGSQFRGAA